MAIPNPYKNYYLFIISLGNPCFSRKAFYSFSFFTKKGHCHNLLLYCLHGYIPYLLRSRFGISNYPFADIVAVSIWIIRKYLKFPKVMPLKSILLLLWEIFNACHAIDSASKIFYLATLIPEYRRSSILPLSADRQIFAACRKPEIEIQKTLRTKP